MSMIEKRCGGKGGRRRWLALALAAVTFGPGLSSWRGDSALAAEITNRISGEVTVTNVFPQLVLACLTNQAAVNWVVQNRGNAPAWVSHTLTNHPDWLPGGATLTLGPLTTTQGPWWAWQAEGGTNTNVRVRGDLR